YSIYTKTLPNYAVFDETGMLKSDQCQKYAASFPLRQTGMHPFCGKYRGAEQQKTAVGGTNIMKKILALGLSACMMASITACSTGTGASATTAGTSAETTADTAAASESAETTAAESGAGESAADTAAGNPEQTEPLLVYLNDFDAVIGDMFKEATGYDVEVVVGNGAETMSRIEAEKSNPQWD